MVGLFSVTANVADLCFGASVIFRIEVSVSVKNFPVGNLHSVPFLRRQRKGHIACHFLSEIYYSLPFGCDKYAFCLYSFLFLDPFPLLRNQVVRSPLRCFHFPGLIAFKGGVISLPVINFAETHFAFFYPERFIAFDHLLSSVVPPQVKAYIKGFRLFLFLFPFFFVDPPRHRAAVPAGSHRHFQTVLFCQKRRHVVLLILESCLIRSPARHQHGVSHFFPVDARFIDTVSGDGKNRPLRRLFQ